MFDIDLGAATSLSVTLLIIGIGMSVYPPLIIKLRGKTHDYVTSVMIATFILILIVASQAIFLARRNPDILIPLVGITVGFRTLSPGIMVSTLKEKSSNPIRWKTFRTLLLLISLGLIFYTFISGMINKTNEDLAVSERVLMTLAVAYTYARAYMKFVQQFFFEWEERYILFSGLLVGISFVILIPFLVPEFDRIYKLTGTIGWLGAFFCLHQNRSMLDFLKRKPSTGGNEEIPIPELPRD
jgi:hypothetical protein